MLAACSSIRKRASDTADTNPGIGVVLLLDLGRYLR